MTTPTHLTVPETPAVPPLIERLVRECAAEWVDETTVADWSAKGGNRVLLLAGDSVQFPEGLDVAAVLPELIRSFPGRFSVAVVPRKREEAVAKRYGSQRWPTLIFLRDGEYVTAVAGMQDWEVYLQAVGAALNMPTSRAPTIGIPVVTDRSTASSCH
jgi:hydrogenase-1 operon protein HyaE